MQKLQGFRLSPQQKQLWQIKNANMVYRSQCAVYIEGMLDAERFKETLHILSMKHEILRTNFLVPPGTDFPLQVIRNYAYFSFTELHYEDVTAQQEKEIVDALFVGEQKKGYKYEEEPPLRVILVNFAHSHYALLMTLPALNGDARTLRELLQQIFKIYTQHQDTQEEAFDDVIQYADASEWQYELLESADGEEGRAYWQQQAVSSPWSFPQMQLARRDPTTLQLASHTITLPPQLVAQIDRLAEQQGVSISAVLLACWQVLLWRYTRITTGSISTLFEEPKFDELLHALGPYSKAVPIRSYTDGKMSFLEAIDKAHHHLQDAFDWLEFFAANDGEQFQDNGGGVSNSEIGFAFEEDMHPWRLGNVSIAMYRQYSCTEYFHLRLSCRCENDVLHAEFLYNPDVYASALVEQIARHFYALMQSALLRAEQPLEQLSIFDEVQWQRFLVELNQTEASDAEPQTIPALFSAQVERTPNATALVCGSDSMTYKELATRAMLIARQLRQRGLPLNTLVGLYLPHSLEIVVGMFGIMLAGGAYLPLDPDLPCVRLQSQLQQSKIWGIITQTCYQDQLHVYSGTKFYLDNIDRDEMLGAQEPIAATDPAYLAYTLFTSGSTGYPKGVCITQRSLANYTKFICHKLRVKAGWSYAHVSSFSGDLGNTALFPALVSGGCLHLLGPQVTTDSRAFGKYLAEKPIDVLKIVPSHLQALLHSTDQNVLPRKYLILGGEAFPYALLKTIVAKGSDCLIINHYGPTETTIGSLVYSVCQEDMSWHGKTVPIGQPIANISCYIVDALLQPVPIGASGELYIGGLGLAWGYLNDPQHTAQRFIPNPFAIRPGERLYRTGDLARYLPDGTIEFLGRSDNQMKILGFRVELEEIEATLRQHPAIQNVAIRAHELPGSSHDQQLVAYIVKKPAENLKEQDFKLFMQERLPKYMQPTSLVMLERLPLTANGKIDRQALHSPNEAETLGTSNYEAPRTLYETIIAEQISELLAKPKIGIHDNFFFLGGHSLLAMKLIARLQDRFQVEIPVRALFDHPTVMELSAAILEEQLRQEDRLLEG